MKNFEIYLCSFTGAWIVPTTGILTLDAIFDTLAAGMLWFILQYIKAGCPPAGPDGDV